LGLAVTTQRAKAAFQTLTHHFTVSNTFGGTADYGTVKLEAYDGVGVGGGGLLAGQIKITVTAFSAPYANGVNGNFGIDKFAFNFNLSSLDLSDIASVPGGWNFDVTGPNSGYGPFGKFDAAADSATGNDERNPLVILISNQGAEAKIANVTFLSDPNGSSGIPTYFVAHVKNFNSIRGTTSHYIGVVELEDFDDVDPVPAPAGLVLLATAIPVLGLRRVFRRKAA
jgi:hypothetical protein